MTFDHAPANVFLVENSYEYATAVSPPVQARSMIAIHPIWAIFGELHPRGSTYCEKNLFLATGYHLGGDVSAEPLNSTAWAWGGVRRLYPFLAKKERRIQYSTPFWPLPIKMLWLCYLNGQTKTWTQTRERTDDLSTGTTA